jgi:hypothetical protein
MKRYLWEFFLPISLLSNISLQLMVLFLINSFDEEKFLAAVLKRELFVTIEK